MKLVGQFLLLAFIAAVSAEEFSSDNLNTAFDYHRRIGIPKASEIKKWEEENVGQDMQRIVGGWNVDITQVPFQAGLIIQLGLFRQSVCGGSLISQTRVVTAAHCRNDGVNNANSFTVVLGSSFLYSGGQRIFTRDVVMHPNWNPSTLNADVAVMRISRVTYSNAIQPINLPSGNELWADFTGWTSTASGFGRTSDGASIASNQRLSAVNVRVAVPNDCARIFGSWFRNTNVCTSGAGIRGVCHGDSGGPLTVTNNNRRILIGVASYVSWRGCSAGEPSVFARVTSFVNWISSV